MPTYVVTDLNWRTFILKYLNSLSHMPTYVVNDLNWKTFLIMYRRVVKLPVAQQPLNKFSMHICFA